MSVSEPSTAWGTVADRYRVLLDIGRTLTGTLGRNDLYRIIHRETSRVIDTSSFHISLYDEETDEARIVFYADRSGERTVDVTYPRSDSEALRTGKPTLIDDRSAGHRVVELEEEDAGGARSAIGAPLIHEGRILGVMSAQSHRPRAYTPTDLELLEGIASIAAVAIENARYVSQLERQRVEAERIEEIGRTLSAVLDPEQVLLRVVDASRTLLEADGAVAWLCEGATWKVHVAAASGDAIPLGAEWELEGLLLDRLIVERGVLVIDDFADSDLVPEHLRDVLSGGSGIAAPLILEGAVGGVLSAGSKTARHFRSDEVRLLQRLATQASLALENARLHAALRALSLTDPLTELANRRHLEMHLSKEVAAAARGRSVGAILFDLDHFKHLNDTLGHTAGDDVLRAFAAILAAENRAMSLVARYGGDEFVSILSDTSVSGMQTYVRRIERRVSGDPLLTGYQVSVSHGCALFDPDRMKTGEHLLTTADQDLYRSKAGRAQAPPATG